MKSSTKFVGLDVSKATIAVAVIGPTDPTPRYLGAIPHTPESVRKLVQRFGPAGRPDHVL